MPATLDLSRAHLWRQHGDLLAVYTWMDDERALILIPAFRKGAPWYVVKESAAFKYDDVGYLAQQSAKACDVLGIEPSRPNWSRVATIIHEGLPDLVRMPSAPLPERMRSGIGQMVVREDGKVVAGQDIRLDKQEGATYG